MNKLATVNIKGKEYVLVKDRIIAFNEQYTNGCIQTEIVSPLESKTVIVKAVVIPDVKTPDRRFVDYSQAVIGEGYINKTSALENASTSAVGRALAYMGIGVIESVASADEVSKAQSAPIATFATDAQLAEVTKLLKKKGYTEADLCKKYDVNVKEDLTSTDALKAINGLSQLPDVTNSALQK